MHLALAWTECALYSTRQRTTQSLARNTKATYCFLVEHLRCIFACYWHMTNKALASPELWFYSVFLRWQVWDNYLCGEGPEHYGRAKCCACRKSQVQPLIYLTTAGKDSFFSVTWNAIGLPVLIKLRYIDRPVVSLSISQLSVFLLSLGERVLIFLMHRTLHIKATSISHHPNRFLYRHEKSVASAFYSTTASITSGRCTHG